MSGERHLEAALEEREGDLDRLVRVARAIWEGTCDKDWESGDSMEYEECLDVAEVAIAEAGS